jgi:hypothetical protein
VTKILVQTQWEAMRFDRVKHTSETRLAVFSVAETGSARCRRLCGTITLTAAAD